MGASTTLSCDTNLRGAIWRAAVRVVFPGRSGRSRSTTHHVMRGTTSTVIFVAIAVAFEASRLHQPGEP